MSTFCCIAKTAVKTKTNVFLQIDVPKKATFVSSGVECCSTRLDTGDSALRHKYRLCWRGIHFGRYSSYHKVLQRMKRSSVDGLFMDLKRKDLPENMKVP